MVEAGFNELKPKPRPETARLFIAFGIPDPIRNELTKIQEIIKNRVPTRSIRWTTPDHFHLTLKFLGEIPVSKVGLVRESLRNGLSFFKPLELVCENIGAFPNLRYPRVIWAGVRALDESLMQLQRLVEKSVLSFLLERQTDQNFTGHITIARVKELEKPQADLLVGLAKELSSSAYGQWTARDVRLMQSKPVTGGTQHFIIDTFA